MNFLKRLLTGLGVVALISVCLLSGRFWTSCLCFCMVVACVLEFLTIMNKGKGLHSNIIRTLVAALMLFLAITYNLTGNSLPSSGLYMALFLFVLLLLPAGTLPLLSLLAKGSGISSRTVTVFMSWKMPG